MIDANTGPAGVRGTTPVGNTALAATSGRPQPRRLSGAARLAAYAASAWRSAPGPSAGWSCLSSAAAAATNGVANDVPFNRRTPLGPLSTQTSTPGAVRSGFRRPSAVGPRAEKPASVPSESSAPTVITESASPGVTRVRKPGPSFPAAVTTRMPWAAALSAATVVTATWPFRSAGVYVKPSSNRR